MAAQPAALKPAEAQHAVHKSAISLLLLLDLEKIHTEDAGHDGDARILGLALGIVHPQRLQRGETNGLCTP